MLHLLFLGDIPHNDRIDTIFMLVSNYLITGELATVTLRYIESIPWKSSMSKLVLSCQNSNQKPFLTDYIYPISYKIAKNANPAK